MPYFFDNVDKAVIAQGDHASELVAAMCGSLVSLAYTGDPNHDGLQQWPTYTHEERPTMIFDTPCSLCSDPFGAERLLWQDVPLGNLLMGVAGKRRSTAVGRGTF
jgi:para-nitrobenzyl esterase